MTDSQSRTLHKRSEIEMRQLRADTVEILRPYTLVDPFGRPLLARELSRGITDRDASELVAMIPGKLAEPTCPCGKGYYYGNTPDEIDAGVKFIYARISGLVERAEHLKSIRDVKIASGQGRLL